MLRKALTVVGAALITAIAFGGCGGGDDEKSGTGGSGKGGSGGKGSGGSAAGISLGGSGNAAASDGGGKGGASSGDACASSIVNGTLIPSSLLFVVDRSGSMNCNLPVDGQSTAECEIT